MSKLKTVKLVTVLISLWGVSSAAIAQTAPAANTAAVVTSTKAVNTAQLAAKPASFTMKRVRVVKSLPTQSKKTKSVTNAFIRKTSAGSARIMNTDKFVQNNGNENMNTPVYFSEKSFGAR